MSDVQALLRASITATDHEERYRLIADAELLGVEPARDLPLFIELLDEDAWLASSLAVWEIGKLGPDGAAAVPRLCEVVDRDTIIDPRWAALWALERLGPAAVPATATVIRVLREDGEPDMRSQAANALGSFGVADQVLDALAAGLDDDDSLVREESATALGRIGPTASGQAEALSRLATSDPLRVVRDASITALRRVGEDERATRAEAEVGDGSAPAGLAAALRGLESSDPRTRAESTWPVGKFGPEAGPGLTAIVRQMREDHDPDARWGASWVVGRLRSAARPAAADIVATMRHDPDPDVRAQAAQSLGLTGASDAASVDALVDALGDERASLLREEAAVALGRLGDAARSAVLPLRCRLADRHRMVRLRAGAALARIQSE